MKATGPRSAPAAEGLIRSAPLLECVAEAKVTVN
jgi:hypothetical protein